MGLPLRQALANTYFVFFEKYCLRNVLSNLKPQYCQHYVDDIFALFTSQENSEVFQHFLNDWHADMSFAIKNEKQNRLFFLDIRIISEDKRFTTPVYRKQTFRSVYTHFEGFLQSAYMFSTV